MDILVACDSFKESLTAEAVVQAIIGGFREIYPDARYHAFPMADGGEGTAAIMARTLGGRLETRDVCGPLGVPVSARFAVLDHGRTALIELAEAAGLAQTPLESRSPLFTTTYGVGELMSAALDMGCRHLVLALGGSATCDGGAGLLQALGVSLRDLQGQEIPHGGGPLGAVFSLDDDRLDPRLAECRIEILCDVTAPLLGETGAVAVFGPQKGATPAMIPLLEASLARLASLVELRCGRDLTAVEGMGAAGGAALGLVGLCGARLVPGAEAVAGLLGLDTLVSQMDLVITGEGRLDRQTAQGKAPQAIATLAKKAGKPVIAFAGTLGVGHDDLLATGFDAVFSCLERPCTLEEAFGEAEHALRRCARNVAATLALGRSFQAAQA
ncbi:MULTISPECIES: glycerate kinase [Asaia]|uniref:Glycerate kinase n=1 Tax=Asaia bogorensis TaxID=91915 RepID=A0A060QLZ8_9PROT|nr:MULTISPECIES: glycerate kinase [Asaia]ETC98358.1 glycerate kinase [Asaia sp. SF2.1]MDL2170948.1 glycerate kinase [Asaia sp. HumB]CDG40797.1 Glycerate kinase [Asaia bogorensis]